MCLVRSPAPMDAYPQPSQRQTKRLSPAWARKWYTRQADCANDRLQSSYEQTKGFSPVWMRRCLRRLYECAKVRPQSSYEQTKGFFPEWVPGCVVTSHVSLNLCAQPRRGWGKHFEARVAGRRSMTSGTTTTSCFPHDFVTGSMSFDNLSDQGCNLDSRYTLVSRPAADRPVNYAV